jgi:hypothetical protein
LISFAHEVEKEINLNDEEFEDPVEVALAYVPIIHEDKEMVIFSHTGGLMKETLDMVDEYIDTFIYTGRRTWDFCHLIFYKDPIYDIEGISQAKQVDLSSSEDQSSCVYDSDVLHLDDYMVIDLFRPFEDDLSQHF